MNEMTTEQAVQNLDNLIAATRMTRQEHIGMQQSLEHLRKLAEKSQEIEKGADDNGESLG